MRRSALFALGCLVVGLAGARGAPAQEPPPDRTVYVPFEDFGEVLKKDAAGVLLPREMFEDLRKRALANRGGSGPPRAAVESAVWRAEVSGEALRGTGTLTLKAPAPGTHLLPLGLEGIGLLSARLDGAPALLARGADGALSAVVPGGGARRLDLEFSAPVAETPRGRRVALRIPRAPAGSLEIVLPGDQEASVDEPATLPPAEVRRDPAGPSPKTTTVRVAVGGLDSVAIRFRSRVEEAPRDAVLLARVHAGVALAERLARARWQLQYAVYRAKSDKFRIPVPEGWVLTGVEAPDLAGWEVAAGVLEIRLRAPVEGRLVVSADLEKLLSGVEVDVPLPEPAGVARREGRLDVAAVRGLRVRPLAEEGLRESGPEGALPPPPGVAREDEVPWRSYQYAGAAPRLRVSLGRIEPKLAGNVRALVRVEEGEARVSADLAWQVLEGRLFSLSLPLPVGVAVTRLEAEGRRVAWEVTGEGEARRLAVSCAPPVETGQSLVVTLDARRDLELPPGGAREIAWPLPGLAASEAGGFVGFAVDRALSLRETKATGVEPVDARTVLPEQGIEDPDLVLGYRVTGTAPAVSVEVREEVPRVALSTVSYVSLREDVLHTASHLAYAIQAGALREVRVLLPPGTGRAAEIRGEGIAERQLTAGADGDLWRVLLREKVRGTYCLEVAWDRKLPAGESVLPRVRGAGVAAEEGVIAIEAAERTEIEAKPEGLRELDLAEVPPIPGYAPGNRVLFAYRYQGPDASLRIRTTRFPQGSVATLVVLSSAVRTQVDPAAGETTEARLRLAEAGLQSLAISVPADAEILSLTVDGEGVKPARSGDKLLVPLPGRIAPERELRVLYARRDRGPGAIAAFTVEPPVPEAGIPLLASGVTLFVPSDLRVVAAGGSLERSFVIPGRSALRLLYERNRAIAVGGALGLVLTLLVATGVIRLPRGFFAPRVAPRWIGVGAVALLGIVVAWQVATPGMLRSKTAGEAAPAAAAPASGGYIRGPADHNETDSIEESEVAKEEMPQRPAGATRALRLSRAPRAAPATPAPTAPRGPAAPPPAAEAPAEGEPPVEDQVQKDAEQDGDRGLADRPRRDGVGGGARGRFAGRAGGKRAVGGTIAGGLGGGAVKGLQSLNLPFDPSGTAYPFRGGAAGGTARLWLASSGLLRGLAGLLLLAGLLGTLALPRRPALAAAALPLAILLLTLVPEVAPGLATPCNAGILGIGAGAALLLGARILREIGRRGLGAGAAAATALAVLSASTSAQAQEPRPPVPPKEEHRVYVPYDPANAAKPPRGPRVYLPYGAFLRLFSEAYPERLPFAGPTAVGGVVRAEYKTALKDVWLTGTASFLVRAAGDGPVEVPLGLAGAQVESATVGGRPAPLRVLPGGGVAFLGAAPGEWPVEIVFRAKGTGTAKGGSLEIGLSGAPVSTLRAELADRDLTAKAGGALGAQSVARGDGSPVLSAELGAAPRLSFRWEPHAAARVSEGPAVAAETRTFLLAGEGHQSLRVRAEFRLSGGERDSFRLGIAPDLTVLDVRGENLRAWAVEGEGADRQLRIRLDVPTKERAAFDVIAERKLSAPTGSADLPRIEPLDTGRETGFLALFAAPHLRVAVEEYPGLAQVQPDRIGPEARGAAAAFRHGARPFSLRYASAPLLPRARGECRLDVRVRRETVEIAARLRFRASAAPLHRVSALVPGGFRLRGAEGAELLDRWESPGPEGTTRVTALLSRPTTTPELRLRLESPLAAEDRAIPVPRVRLEGVDRQQGEILVQADPGLSLASRDLASLVEVPAGDVEGGGAGIAFRYTDPEFRGTLTIARLEPKLSADWVLHSVVTARGADHALFVRFRAESAPAREFVVTLPASLAGVEVSVDGLRESRVERAGDRWRVTAILQHPVLGDVPVGIYAHAEVPEGEPQAIPVPTIPGVERERERGHVLVAAGEGQARVEASGLSGLRDVRPGEVPEPPPFVDLARVALAWRVETRAAGGEGGPAARVRLRRLEQQRGAGVAVDLLQVETVLSPEGEARSVATLRMQNQVLQFLRVRLPSGARLLSLFVAGEAARPGTEADALLVPLPRLARGDLAFAVEITYAQTLGGLGGGGEVAPGQPILQADVPVTRVAWTVRIPEGFAVVKTSGDMKQVADAAEFEVVKTEAEIRQAQQLLGLIQSGEVAEAERALSNVARAEETLRSQLEATKSKHQEAVQKGADEAWAFQNRGKIAQQEREYAQLKQQIERVVQEKAAEKSAANAPEQQAQELKRSLSEFRKKGGYREAEEALDARAADKLGKELAAKRRLAFDDAEKKPFVGAAQRDAKGDEGGQAQADQPAPAKAPLPATATPGALSIRVPLPPGGTPRHYLKDGRLADLRLRLVREAHLGVGTDLLRLAAVLLLFLALRARGLLVPGAGALVRLAFLGTALVAAGAALSSPTVAGAIALVAAVDLLRSRRSTPAASSR
ncbi:MAG: hypothetical protein L0216_13395 [Planctomycetales bacterium]|nr:hypothetical protein [Planctomycetales bacterium]